MSACSHGWRCLMHQITKHGPPVLRLWQRNDRIVAQLWIKNLNGTFSKLGLQKLRLKAVAESPKIPVSGSARALSLSVFQDHLIWESKCCQSRRFQGNSAQEMPRNWLGDLRGSPADPYLPGFAGLSFRPSLLTVLTNRQTLPRTYPAWAFPPVRSGLKHTNTREALNQKACCRNYHRNKRHPAKGTGLKMYVAKRLRSNHPSHLLSVFQQHPQALGRDLHSACTTTSKYRARRRSVQPQSFTHSKSIPPFPGLAIVPPAPNWGGWCRTACATGEELLLLLPEIGHFKDVFKMFLAVWQIHRF